MTDGWLLGALKRAVRATWILEFGFRRKVRQLRGQAQYRLGGSCESCAKCCEEPTIVVGKFTWFMPVARNLYLWWQKKVNGFHLLRTDREALSFVFTCSHFDTKTRRCDSYATRPFMCMDYPRLVLEQPWPEFFDECGYRAINKDGAGLSAALDNTSLTEEQKAKLRRKLHVL